MDGGAVVPPLNENSAPMPNSAVGTETINVYINLDMPKNGNQSVKGIGKMK